jgi:DNA-binding NarL/FixJ family response regulator
MLDVVMDELSGLELQQQLAADGCHRPIIFLSGRADIPISVRAMRAGALTFLTKPVDGDRLRAAICLAVEKDRAGRELRAELDAINRNLATRALRTSESELCGLDDTAWLRETVFLYVRTWIGSASKLQRLERVARELQRHSSNGNPTMPRGL